MMGYTLRNLTKDDLPQIMALQKSYQAVNPGTVVIPAESYLSPVFENGKNILCALDETSRLGGYAAIAPNISYTEDTPHTLWSVVKVDPALSSLRPLQDMLFDKVVERSGEILHPYPGDNARLVFQHRSTETSILEFLKSRGCNYMESVFHMLCDLDRIPEPVPVPVDIDIRDLKDDIREQQAYIDARNECFPTHVTNLNEWQYFLKNVIGGKGKVIAAFNDCQIIGSVLVYWNEEINKQLGLDMGQTEYVFVRESWRNKGIAMYLVNLGLKYLKEQGLRLGHLEVRADNENALMLYKKTGYTKAGEEQFYFKSLTENIK